jgi:tetratricopeptide (TPR) repeat protein
LKRFCLIIIISVISFLNAFTQSLEESLAFANKLYSEKNYEAALRQYKRVLFFDEVEKYGYIHQRLADCYFAQQTFDKALFEYSIAYNVESKDSIKNEITFKRVLIYTLQQNYSDVNMELLSLNDSLSDYFSRRRAFYNGVISLQIDSVKTAKSFFIKALYPEDSISIKKTDSLFARYHSGRPNPKVARVLSVIIPGMGQIYIGDYKNAINSFILTGALATVFMIVAINYTFMDAFVGVLPNFQRYYFGGIKKVASAAREKQLDRKTQMLNSVLSVFATRKK